MYAEKAILQLLITLSEYIQSFHLAVMHLSIKFGGNIFVLLDTKFIEIQYGGRRHMDSHEK